MCSATHLPVVLFISLTSFMGLLIETFYFVLTSSVCCCFVCVFFFCVCVFVLFCFTLGSDLLCEDGSSSAASRVLNNDTKTFLNLFT